MRNYLNTSIGRLRILAFLEGVSLLFMLFVSVPLRLLTEIQGVSKVAGTVHGVLFLLFVINTLRFGVESNWKFRETTWKVILACIIPFGLFYIDMKILKPIHLEKMKS